MKTNKEKGKLELLADIKDFIEDIEYDLKEITEYDENIDYNNEPNLYRQCPHCNSEEYNFVGEVLEDAIMKVRCSTCENYYYINFGK